MGKIIIASFKRSRLPRRLLNDGWWLETPPARPVTAFSKRNLPKTNGVARPRVRHLTLISNPGK